MSGISSSSQTSSLLGNQFTNEIPLTATVTSSSLSQNATASSSVTIDKNFLMQLMAQVAQTNQAVLGNTKINQVESTGKTYVDSFRLSNGGRYTGYVDKDKKPCGTGKLIYPSDEEIRIYAYQKRGGDSRTSYEGEFENGVPNGIGTIVFTSGATYVGRVVDGRMEGRGDFASRGGNVKYNGSFKNNFFHGQGELIEEGTGFEKKRWVYNGAWENGIMHGKGKAVDSFYVQGQLCVETTEGDWDHGQAASCCTPSCVIL